MSNLTDSSVHDVAVGVLKACWQVRFGVYEQLSCMWGAAGHQKSLWSDMAIGTVAGSAEGALCQVPISQSANQLHNQQAIKQSSQTRAVDSKQSISSHRDTRQPVRANKQTKRHRIK